MFKQYFIVSLSLLSHRVGVEFFQARICRRTAFVFQIQHVGVKILVLIRHLTACLWDLVVAFVLVPR